MNSEADLPLSRVELPGLQPIASGKVREIYRIDVERLLIVATDRISAFDCILPDPIPRKGEVLTQLSIFWFDFLQSLVPNHFLSAAISSYSPALHLGAGQLRGRSMLVRAAEMVPVECVARGYLAGSGWKDYQQTGSICGFPLPPGLHNGDRLPEPIFTPASKSSQGHDENVSFSQISDLVGTNTASTLRDLTLEIYRNASEYALSRGIIVADTKFEFGFIDGRLSLCDEVLTPDSSRFWPADAWIPGKPQRSFDKQFVRDYLETLDWDKRPPAPNLPQNIISKTSVKYLEAYRVLTGRSL